MKKLALALLNMFLVGVLLLAIAALSYSNSPEQKEQAAKTVVQPALPTYARVPEVDQMFADLGITDIAQIEVKLTDQTACEWSATLKGCALAYSDHVTIHLTSNWQREPNKYSTIAHEYLHWQWTKGNRANSNDLMAVYNSNSYFRERMAPYNDLGVGSEPFLNELNSTACTEWADSALPFNLINYCTKHIPNRSLLPSYYR